MLGGSLPALAQLSSMTALFNCCSVTVWRALLAHPTCSGCCGLRTLLSDGGHHPAPGCQAQYSHQPGRKGDPAHAPPDCGRPEQVEKGP